LDPLVSTLAFAGIAAPIVFTLVVILQGWLQPDYSHVALPISALAAWPAGWIQNANFYVFGVLTAGYAIGLHLGVHPSRRGLVGPAILVLSGAGIVLAGVFPWTRDGSGTLSVPTGHIVAAFLAFLGAGIGLIVISRRMAGDPRWRDVASYTLASGLIMVSLFVAMGVLAVPDAAPFHSWVGLFQRAVLAVWFPCTIVLALRLLRIAETPNRSVNLSERRS
jgi:hypothetical membrane protein